MMARFSTTMLAAALFLSASAQAQQEELAGEQSTAEKPYEIIITPTVSRANLRSLISDVEEDFYEKFNEINVDDDYDIFCYKQKPTMSHISRRICEPLFMYKARGDMASEVTFFLSSGNPGAQAMGMAMLKSDRQLVSDKHREFDKLLELLQEHTRSNPEFRQIGNVLAELKYRLENYRKN